MVMPMDSGSLALDSPTSEFLRLRPLLKLCLVCLALTAFTEVIAGYIPAAITDFLTVLYGVMLLRRDVNGLIQGLPAVTLIAGLNCALQAFSLLQLLSTTPGAKHFLSDTCVVSVPQVKDGQTSHKEVDLCSWRTIIGNIALCVAVVLEFICMRISFKMLKSMREAASSSLMSFLDVEGGASRSQLTAQDVDVHLGAAGPSTSSEGLRGGQRSTALLGVSGAAAQNFVGQGFVPYQGQAHKLVD